MKADIKQLTSLYIIMMWKGLIVFITFIYSILDVVLVLILMHLMRFM